MKQLRAFSWGYWGWGNHTRELIDAVDAVERRHGRRPPIFVDIRFSRSVRAQGFCGTAFEEAVGKNRYLWLRKLGNALIGTGQQGIKIADPTGVDELLEHIADADKQNRRIIFFCNCERPCDCHRTRVAGLLVRSAFRKGNTLSVVEWPGGVPKTIRLSVSDSVVTKVLRGANRVPLTGMSLKNLHELAALPWDSRVRLRSDVRDIAIVSGPAKLSPCWYLPLLGPDKSRETDTVQSLAGEAARKRKALGYSPVESALYGV